MLAHDRTVPRINLQYVECRKHDRSVCAPRHPRTRLKRKGETKRRREGQRTLEMGAAPTWTTREGIGRAGWPLQDYRVDAPPRLSGHERRELREPAPAAAAPERGGLAVPGGRTDRSGYASRRDFRPSRGAGRGPRWVKRWCWIRSERRRSRRGFLMGRKQSPME